MENQEMKTPFEEDWKFLLEETSKNIARFNNISDIVEGKYENRKGVTPHEVIYQKNRFRIIHYISDHPKRFKTPLLIVYALINRFYILDLTEEKSFIRFLLERGFDVYMIDWGKPSKVEGQNTIGDYIERYMDRGLEKVLEFTGASQVNLCGYCLGALMSIIYTAMHQDKVKNLVLLTPPVDFDDEGVLTKMTNPEYFNLDKIVEHFDHLIPSEFVQTGFDFKNMIGNLLSNQALWSILWNKKALEDYFPMNYWVHDNVPIASAYWAEYIKKFYMENNFMKNNVVINGKKIDLKKIVCPVLAVAAQSDDIVTVKCAEGSMKIVGSTDKAIMVKKGGHIGVMTGSMAKNEVWPDIFTWMADRSERIVQQDGNIINIK